MKILKFLLIFLFYHGNCRKQFRISSCNKKAREKIIKYCKKDLIQAINECIYNTLIGNIQLDQNIKNKLTRHKYCLRKIINNKTIKKKKELILQNRGFLQSLLLSAIVLITSILDNLSKKNKKNMIYTRK